VAFGLVTPPANAHQSPPGCFANGLDVNVIRDRTTVRPGQSVNYTVKASNAGAGACDITNATITFAPPGADGTPSSTPMTLASGLDLPAGSVERVITTVPWVANVNAGVTDAAAQVSMAGVLHDAPVDHMTNIVKGLGTTIVDPKLGLTVTASPPSGASPLSVTYHFALTNLGTGAPAPLTIPLVNFPLCTPAVYATGDTDLDGAIDSGETWDLTCTHVFAGPGDYTATTVASAIAFDGLPVTTTAPALTVHVTVPVSTAHLTLTKVASPSSGVAPLAVTYTYTVLNDGPSTPISGITVNDAGCAPVTTSAPNTPLAAAASRTFTCSTVYAAGTYTSSAIASGTDTVTNTLVSSALSSTQITATLPTDPDPTATPTATATPLPSEPTATPTPTPIATAGPTPTLSSRLTFAYTGRFSPARSCRGTVTLALKAGTKTLATKRVKLDSKCRYKVDFAVLRGRLGVAKKVTVTAKAGTRTASRQLIVPARS
jgi:uncharacterized repeat protein (TIGR01451 family)